MINQTDKTINFKNATSEPLLTEVKKLFCEYQQSIDTDLCFQKFEEELATLPGKYALPKGRLYLLYENEHIVGCVALRELKNESCEMKRLYVKPEFRGKGFGRILAKKIIQDAKEIGYKKMFLDTLDTMQAAVKLYTSLGFKDAPEYCYNPIAGAIFMYLDL